MAEPWTRVLSVKNAKLALSLKGVDASQVVEKAHLLDLVSKKFRNIDEINELLQSPTASSQSATTVNSQEAISIAKATLEGMKNMPFKQLKYQAAVMKRDPSYVRRQNPSLAAATDDQIIATAEEMEVRASTIQTNPEAEEELNTESAIENMLDMVINRPNDLKNVLLQTPQLRAIIGGQVNVIDEQIASLKPFVSKNKKNIKGSLIIFARAIKKISEGYKLLDRLTGGFAKYFAVVIVAIILYVTVKMWWMAFIWVWRNTGGRFWSKASPASSIPGSTEPMVGLGGGDEWAEYKETATSPPEVLIDDEF